LIPDALGLEMMFEKIGLAYLKTNLPYHDKWHGKDSFRVKTGGTVLGAKIFIVYYNLTKEHSKK
jgi:glutamate formiminotransferase